MTFFPGSDDFGTLFGKSGSDDFLILFDKVKVDFFSQ